ETNSDLIIFGTKGGSGLRDTLLGSAVNYVIRHTPCPVITIRNRPEYLGFKRILVPIDISKETGEKVNWGVRMAKMYGADLHLFSVVAESGKDQARIEARTRKSIAFAKENGVESVVAEAQEASGTIPESILKYADKCDADLICVMTQAESESSVTTNVLGTVADRLVNVSQRPVFSIRPERHYHTRTYESPLFK
ncbi:MAG: universal stress protein, partial [Bacteroidota bacterium]